VFTHLSAEPEKERGLYNAFSTAEELLDDYPYLEYEDIMQAIAYAAWAVDSIEEVIIYV